MFISAIKYPADNAGKVAVCIMVFDSPNGWVANVATTPEQAEAIEEIASETQQGWEATLKSTYGGKRTLKGLFRRNMEVVNNALSGMAEILGPIEFKQLDEVDSETNGSPQDA